MGRAGDCGICYCPKRTAIETARAGGMSYADLSRTYGLPETSIRRHFKLGHVLPKPAAKPRQHPKVASPPLVTMEHLRKVGAEFGIPIADMVFHQIHCRKGDIELVSDAEGDEITEMMRAYATDEEFAAMLQA